MSTTNAPREGWRRYSGPCYPTGTHWVRPDGAVVTDAGRVVGWTRVRELETRSGWGNRPEESPVTNAREPGDERGNEYRDLE